MTRLRAVLRDLATDLSVWFLNPKCPWCGHRTSALEAHMRVDHAGDDVRSRP